MIAPDQRRRRLESAVFLLPFISYAYFYQGSDQSVADRFDLIRAMLEKHALWIDGFCGYNTADIISLGSHYYSVKAPGGSFTALIPWALISNALLPMLWRSEAAYWAFTTYLTTLFTVGLLTAAACVVMYRFGVYLGASEGRSAGVAILLGIATIAFPYATELTGEPIAGACAFISFYLVATTATESPWWRSFVAGFLAGWAVLNDYPALLIAAAIGIYAIYRLPRFGELALYSAGAAITAIILFGYNWGAFGHPLFFSYEAYKMVGNNQFPEQAVGFVGLTYPRLDILWNILIDPQRGLFFCNPMLLLAIPGVAWFARLRPWRKELVVTAIVVVGMILFNASYGESIVSWGGGTATGPRQIVAIVPFIVLPILFLPAACDALIGGLGALSVWLMLMATATNPHFPYEYDNPLRDFAAQLYLRGDFAMNRDSFYGGPLITRDSIAFNLGKLLRLPGWLQLWPLGGVWLLGAMELIEVLEPWPKLGTRRLATAAIGIGIVAIFLPSITGIVRRPVMLAGKRGLLGRYYFDDQPGESPPQFERVDRQIDFDDIASMGAVPFPSVAVWSGELLVPRTGIYDFQIEVDDAGWLKIDGHSVIPDPGDRNVPHAEGQMYLTEGRHNIEVGERNLAGGSYIHLFWQLPGESSRSIISADALAPEALQDVR